VKHHPFYTGEFWLAIIAICFVLLLLFGANWVR
jgi:hypothetical protein